MAVETYRMDRRTFLTGLGTVAVVGSAATVGLSTKAEAATTTTFSTNPAPEPIPFLAGPTGAPAPFDLIHWTLPGPEGAITQINELPAFGLDVHRSTIVDYDGFTAYAVVAGKADSSEGELDVELDIRVMAGRYVAADGNTYDGTFGFF